MDCVNTIYAMTQINIQRNSSRLRLRLVAFELAIEVPRQVKAILHSTDELINSWYGSIRIRNSFQCSAGADRTVTVTTLTLNPTFTLGFTIGLVGRQ